jgi:ankyrin repeat protein
MRTLAFDEMVREGATLICIASYFGAVNCFRYLLANNADPCLEDDHGRNLTHFACAGGSLEILSMLSQFPVKWNSTDADGSTCVHYAALFGHPEALFWLWTSCNCDFSAVNVHKMSPLHFAAWRGEVKSIGFLVEQGCGVNAKNDRGSSPLHLAASRPVLSVVIKLLSLGADPTLEDNSGRIPYDCACESHYVHIQQVLLDYSPDNLLFTKSV